MIFISDIYFDRFSLRHYFSSLLITPFSFINWLFQLIDYCLFIVLIRLTHWHWCWLHEITDIILMIYWYLIDSHFFTHIALLPADAIIALMTHYFATYLYTAIRDYSHSLLHIITYWHSYYFDYAILMITLLFIYCIDYWYTFITLLRHSHWYRLDEIFIYYCHATDTFSIYYVIW